MLLPVMACLLGIIIENLRWPQDRSAAMARFQEAEGFGETAWLLLGLVLGHSVVRWLISFAMAAEIVQVILTAPPVFQAAKTALDTNQISHIGLDVLTGLAISVLMTVLAIVARRMAR